MTSKEFKRDATIQSSATMGNESSRSLSKRPALTTDQCSAPLEHVQHLYINEQMKKDIVDTWKQVEKNIAKLGVITFLGLFETHPAVQSLFLPFSQISKEELVTSQKLEAHALKVMYFIQKVIARIDQPIQVYHLLYQLGTSHWYYGAKQDYIDLVGPQFVNAIRPLLEQTWTAQIESAWLHLFSSMSFVMKNAMNDAQHGIVKDDSK